MPTSNEAIYAQGVRNAAATATAAKTTMNDTTNAVLLFTAGANGSLVKRARARAQATNGDSVLYLFTCVDGSSTLYMKAAVDGPPQTISTTIAATEIDLGPSEEEPMRLSPLEKVYCAISVALASPGWVFELEAEDL